MTNEILPELPKWLSELLPAPEYPQLLAVAQDGRLELIQPDGSTESFDTLEDAYNASRLRELDLKIAPEVAKREGGDAFFLSFPNSDNKTSTLVMSYTDNDRVNSLKRGYADFLKAAEAYTAEPNDFAKAWLFVDLHPAFWTATQLDTHPFYWEQEGYTNKLRLHAGRRNDEVVISLDAGSHVEPEYKSHYADWRLEVEGPTYEQAIITLAKHVSLTHNLDGTDNPLADEIFDKPEWVKDLEDRIREYDEDEDGLS